jgi:hypothetical protein
VNLGFAQIYLTLMIDGIGSQPFSAVTLPPIAPPSVSCRDMVIAASRRNFTKPRLEVEKIVTDLHTPEKIEKKSPAEKPKVVPKTETREVKTLANGASNNHTDSAPATSRTPVSVPNQTPAPALTSTSTQTPAPSQAPVRADSSTRTEALAREVKTTAPIQTDYKSRSEKPTFKREVRPTVHKHVPAPGHDVVRKYPPVDKKPASPSTGDLRSILAQIAQSSKPQEKNSIPKESIVQTTKGAGDDVGPATFKKIASTITPLQEALAELKKVDTEKIPRVLPPRPFPLPTSFTPASVIIKTEAENLHSEIESVFASLDKKATPKLSESTLAPEPSPVPLSTPAPERPAVHTSNSGSKETALSSKDIAKILQGGAKERSPFR